MFQTCVSSVLQKVLINVFVAKGLYVVCESILRKSKRASLCFSGEIRTFVFAE